MTIPLTWSLDPGPLSALLFYIGGLLFGFGVGMVWFSRRWALLLIALALVPMGLSLVGQAPAIAGRPAVTITATHIACTPWRRAIAWADVEEVQSEDMKHGRSWRNVGLVLVLKAQALAGGGPVVPDAGWWLRLAGVSRNQVGDIGGLPEPRPGGRLYCQTLDLAYDTEVLKRLTRELVWATNRTAVGRAGLDWCEASGNLTIRCVANADTWHRTCSDRGGDYDACRRGGL